MISKLIIGNFLKKEEEKEKLKNMRGYGLWMGYWGNKEYENIKGTKKG